MILCQVLLTTARRLTECVMLRKTVKIPDVSLTKYAPGHPVTESLLLAVKKGLRNGVQEKDNLQKSFDKKSKIFLAE